MPEKIAEKQYIDLWPGEKVEVVRPELVKDFDFVRDVTSQIKNNDLDFVSTLFVLIGGEPTLEKLRAHAIEETGVFDMASVSKVIEQLMGLIPKASTSSSKRW